MFIDYLEILKESLIKSDKNVEIIFSNKSGEFRHEIHPSLDTLNWAKNEHPELVTCFNLLPYFYSQKEAVQYCELNKLKLVE